MRQSNARRMAATSIALALVAGGCGGERVKKVEIGVQRIGLDLAFKAEGEDQPKAQPQQTLMPTAVPSQAEYAVTVPTATFDEPAPTGTLPPRPVVPTCPSGDGGVPERAVNTTVISPPVAGRYKLHRTGTFEVKSAVFPFKGFMPPKGEKEYRNIQVVPGTTDVLGNKAPDQYQYEVYEQVGDNFTSRTLRITPSAIQLVKQMTKVGGETVTFNPTPAITLVGLGGGVGDSWSSAGVDTATGTSMVVQGKTTKRQNVDLCGTVYDSFVVESTERITNILDQYTSQTDDAAQQASAAAGGEAGKPNTYWVATQFGGLFIQEDFHTSTTLTVEAGGARVPVTLDLDYTNTFDSIDPAGPPSGS